MSNQYKHSNQELFSNHYLEEILPDEREWRDSEGIEEALDNISKLYKDNLTSLPNLNEAQLEDAFIKPILNLLGHHFIPQPREKTAEGIRRPDYALFDTESTKRKASTEKGKEWELFGKAIGLCEAKHWNRELGQSSKHEPGLFDFERRNPAYQMQQYLYYSGVKWGILTNGKKWRLYEREQSKKLDRYYEVDLISLINSDGPLFAPGVSRDEQLEAFKYFFMFFRAKAFPLFLDYVLDGSVRYAEAVGAELKDNVYKALRILAQGFVELRENRLEPLRDKELIRTNCFVLLYRILFILYAESKRLLPVSNRSYKEHYSLESMKEEIFARRDGPPYGTSIPMLWGKLSALSTLIDRGDKGLGIAPYNGGLFDDNQHEFLKKYKIGDRPLAQVIDLLSRPQKKSTAKKEFIDYSSLYIRDLGSIYEGLLENHLEVADEPMVAVKNGKKELWKPLRERKEKELRKTTDSVDKGEYYPVTKRGDRKATGSYYTPDYIVKYIVEQTLEPLTKDIKEKELLLLRVLDPAMGSGHFLVEATDFLARKLLGVKEIEETEDEVGKAKRLIIERCIFGVDKNPLAVELAKLSLWLSTVAANKPLSFLDHHLRCGDSLIGAKVVELGTLPGEKQGSLFQSIVEHYSASTIGFYKGIEDEPSDTIDQIHDKIDLLKKARGMMKPFRQVADVWVSTYFGNEVKPADYSRLLEALRRDDKKTLAALEREKWLERANKLWERNHFFHWELEFPEVFFDKHGRPLENPGFDAVIGNPPYVLSPENLSGNYLSTRYELLSGKPDLYRFFIERSHQLMRNSGRFSFIIPNTLLTIPSCVDLRKYLLGDGGVTQIVNFWGCVFKEASVNSILLLTQKNSLARIVDVVEDKTLTPNQESLDDAYKSKIGIKKSVWLQDNQHRFLLSSSQGTDDVVKKIRKVSSELGDVARYTLGMQVYHNSMHTEEQIKKRVFHSTQKKDDTYWPESDGGNVNRYFFIEHFPNYVSYGDWCYNKPSWDFCSEPRILIREITSETLICSITNTVHIPTKATIIVIPEKVGIYYLLGILNSKLIGFWVRSKGEKSDQRLFPRISLTTVRKIPIRSIDFSKSTDKERHGDMVKLVQAMLDLHKRKQAVIKEYAGWLEHLTGAKLDELSGRDKIRDLEELENVNTLVELISKNRKLSFNTREPRNYELLSKGFEKYRAKLTPFVEEIAETDDKIDKLVYTLYGLTKDEIDIVEGKAKTPLP